MCTEKDFKELIMEADKSKICWIDWKSEDLGKN